MNSIIQQFNNSNKILIATHAHPDGDAIGSLIALGLSLEALKLLRIWPMIDLTIFLLAFKE